MWWWGWGEEWGCDGERWVGGVGPQGNKGGVPLSCIFFTPMYETHIADLELDALKFSPKKNCKKEEFILEVVADLLITIAKSNAFKCTKT